MIKLVLVGFQNRFANLVIPQADHGRVIPQADHGREFCQLADSQTNGQLAVKFQTS